MHLYFELTSPWQFSHLPPLTLNENLPGLYPLIFDAQDLQKGL